MILFSFKSKYISLEKNEKVFPAAPFCCSYMGLNCESSCSNFATSCSIYNSALLPTVFSFPQRMWPMDTEVGSYLILLISCFREMVSLTLVFVLVRIRCIFILFHLSYLIYQSCRHKGWGWRLQLHSRPPTLYFFGAKHNFST